MRKLALAAAAALALAVSAPAALGSASAPVPLRATLTGAAEVPGPGALYGRGQVRLTLDRATGRVCWRFARLRQLGGRPTAAHIHAGRAGRPGGVRVPLGNAYRARGCTVAPKRVVRSILARPGRFYVNVHNAAYPDGAVRGQLRRA